MPDPELHPLLRTRWSPRVYDAGHEVTPAQVASLLEAARWTPSAGNSQPWSFIVGRRGEETHRRLVTHLAGSSRAWAPDASLLVGNLCHRLVEDTDWEASEFSVYDLGQAVAHMTFQGRAMGLQARQFRAFDREALSVEFGVPDHWEFTTMTAFGVVRAPRDPEESSRDRRHPADLTWPREE
ncbi:MAG: nitroreductase family protein [Nocardioides sp.]